jgi:hypothetical protein
MILVLDGQGKEISASGFGYFHERDIIFSGNGKNIAQERDVISPGTGYYIPREGETFFPGRIILAFSKSTLSPQRAWFVKRTLNFTRFFPLQPAVVCNGSM